MRILFLSISSAISNLNNRGIYPDLLRKFAQEGHEIFIVAPAERRQKTKTTLIKKENVTTLLVQTLNITKTNLIEKGISTLLIEVLFSSAIGKYFKNTQFDLILYATPPITFNDLIRKIKMKNQAATYLLLKDIFPQNAVDLGVFSKHNPLYWYFKKKETNLYMVSDYIGCMSPANIDYIKKNNPEIPENKLEICPNSILPVNLEEYSTFNNSKIREQYAIPSDRIICIYGGNLGKPQGIDFLVRVLDSNKKRDDVFFVIAGSGTEAYKIRNFIEKNNPINTLFINQLPKIEFDSLLFTCDIAMIFLDNRYTIPNYPSRLLNYLEFKKPVIMATDRNTDIGSIAMENKYGFWVESGEIDKYNYYLDQLINNATLRKKMGENGYFFLLKNYTVDKTYRTILSHFN